jgi:DNA-directed RNA polymerase specialized sigma subunit
VFIYLYKNLNYFNPKQNTFPLWLRNNARNIAIEKLCSLQEDNLGNTSFKTLPLAEKTVFVLHHFRSYSMEEIAAMLPLSPLMVERLLQSAEAKIESNCY